MKTEKLFYGAAYYDEYMPYDRIDEDMRLMKDAGMNLIRIAESTWSTWEVADGVFDFTHLNRMLDKAEEYGISVIVGTPTYAVPTWLVRKYPEIMATTHSGKEIYGRRQNMDITNPDYRRYAERMIRKLMEQCAGRKAVIGYQIDNETGTYDTAGPAVQAAFVEALKNKYPDIQDFNHEFGLDYWSNRINAWEDFPDVRGTINASLDAEFKKFQRELVTEFLNWQISIVREYCREDQFITHNFDYGWNGCSHGIKYDVDQFEAAKNMDVVGCDIYHPSAGNLTGAEITFGGALARGLKRDNYLVLETEAQGNPGWLPYPGQLRLQAFSHLANGADCVEYWHWHSIHNSLESYWKGVLSHNLKPNATYREAQTIGRDFARLSDSLKNLQKENKVAVMVSTKSMIGLDEFKISEDLRYNDILCQITDALYRLNIEYDIICDTASSELLAHYSLLVVPAMYSASRDTIARLGKYTEQGGHLFMTFKSCFANENLKIYADDQPYGLTQIFGMTYDQFTLDRPQLTLGPQFASKSQITADSPSAADSQSALNSPSAAEASFTSIQDKVYTVSHFMELLIPDIDTKVLASYNHPAYQAYAAITQHTYGNGCATYLGCDVEPELIEMILSHVCKEAGLSLPAYCFPLIIKEGINEAGKRIRYYMNFSESRISFTNPNTALELLSDMEYSAGQEITLDPWGLCIMEVTR